MSDKEIKPNRPHATHGLSVRAANALYSLYHDGCRSKYDYAEKCGLRTFNLNDLERDEFKGFIREDLKNKMFALKRVKGVGSKIIKEINNWLEEKERVE